MDPDDLWDFGTVRHVNRPTTIGRSNQIQVSGPPLTWENDGTTRSDGSSESRRTGSSNSSSGSSTRYESSITVKGELPALPAAATTKRYDQQATVRHMPAPGGTPTNNKSTNNRPGQYEDYDDQYDDEDGAYPNESENNISEKLTQSHLDDDLVEHSMLDSVVLPAIASVS